MNKTEFLAGIFLKFGQNQAKYFPPASSRCWAKPIQATALC